MKKLFLLIAAAMVMYSCGSDSETDIPEPEQKAGKGVRFSSSIEGNTLRSTGAWKPGDEIYVYMIVADTLNQCNYGEIFGYNQVPAVYITTAGDGMFVPKTAEDELFYPEDGAAVNFVSYATPVPVIDKMEDVSSVPLCVLDTIGGQHEAGLIFGCILYQEDQSKLDLLTAKNLVSRTKNNSNDVVQFEFKHVMCKWEFNISAEGALTDSDLVGLKVHTKGINYYGFNMFGDRYSENWGDWNSGLLMMGNDGKKIVNFKTSADGRFSEATLLPNCFAEAGYKKLVFELANGEEYEWTYHTSLLQIGIKRKYNIVLSKVQEQKKAMQVGESTITDWSNAPVEDVIVK